MHNKIAAVAICFTAFAMSAAAQVTGSGTAGTVPVFTGSGTSIGNSSAPITVSSTGNVGIGTTASSQNALQVVSSSGNAGQFVITVPSPTSTDAQNLTSMSGAILKLQNLSVTPGNFSELRFYDASNNWQGSMGMMYGAHTAVSQGTYYIEPRMVSTPSAFVVAPSGNVGIGTSTPGALLQVSGASSSVADNGVAAFQDKSNNGLTVGYDTSNNWSWLYSRSVGVTARPIALFSNNTNPNLPQLLITTAGNVGIGTANPGAKLEVSGSLDRKSVV